jgi:hypothetical protein
MQQLAVVPLILLLGVGAAHGRGLDLHDAQPPPVSRDAYLLQLSYDNRANEFLGLAQLALHTNLASRGFYGGVQLGIWNSTRDFVGVSQIGAQNLTRNFVGLGQLGIHNVARDFHAGLVQLGVYNQGDREFYAGFQIGVVNEAGSFIGGAQIGVYNAMIGDRDFMGPGQIGVVNRVERSASMVIGQWGLWNIVERGPVYAPVQVAGLNLAERFRGVAQLAIVNWTESTAALVQGGVLNVDGGSVSFSQIGLVNFAREMVGVQIGVFNFARRLRGIQLGLLNLTRYGGLPFCPIANAGF